MMLEVPVFWGSLCRKPDPDNTYALADAERKKAAKGTGSAWLALAHVA